MKLPSKSFWHDFKLVGITVVIFVMAISAYFLWTTRNQNLELKQENTILKNTNEEIMKQINQDSIILRLEKK